MSVLVLDYGYDKKFEKEIWSYEMKEDIWQRPSQENFEKYLNAFERSSTKLHSNYIFLETYFSQLSKTGAFDDPKGQKLRKKYDKITKPYIKKFLIFSIENSLENKNNLEKDYKLFLQLKKIVKNSEYKNLIDENTILHFLDYFSQKIENIFENIDILDIQNLLIFTKICKDLSQQGLIFFTDQEAKILTQSWKNKFENADWDDFETLKLLDQTIFELEKLNIGENKEFVLSGYGKDLGNFLYGKIERFGIGKLQSQTPRSIHLNLEKYQETIEKKKRFFAASGKLFY